MGRRIVEKYTRRPSGAGLLGSYSAQAHTYTG